MYHEAGNIRAVYSSNLKIEATFLMNRRLTFNGLHGVITKKTKQLITTAVATKHPLGAPL
jgi:hypothetical protein